MRKKLCSSKGMTLTELLVALAIVALIGVALTTGVSSAARIYRDATQLYEAETLCGTILTYLEDEFRFGRNIYEKTFPLSEKAVVFDSQAFGKGVRVIVENGEVKIKRDEVEMTGSSDPAPEKVYDLLGDRAYTSSLRVVEGECSVSYDETNRQVTITIAVGPDDTSVYAKHTVKVVPVDN